MKGSATTKDLGNELATKSPATKRNTEIVLRAHNYALHSVVLIQDLFTRTVKHISTIQSTIYAKLKLWLRLYSIFAPTWIRVMPTDAALHQVSLLVSVSVSVPQSRLESVSLSMSRFDLCGRRVVERRPF